MRFSRADDEASSAVLRVQYPIAGGWTVLAVVAALTGRREVALATALAVLVTLAGRYVTLRDRSRAATIGHLTIGASCAALATIQSFYPELGALWFYSIAPPIAAWISGRVGALGWTAGTLALMALGSSISNQLADLAPFALVTFCGLVSTAAAPPKRKREKSAAPAEARLATSLTTTMGHEIRTPLHGMLGTAQILSETALDPEQREMVDTLKKSGTALRQIVDEVLDLARLQQGELRIVPRPTDVHELLEDIVDLFAGEAASKSLTLVSVIEGLDEIALRIDPNRVRQILANLVGNAVKFTEEGHVVIRANAVRASDITTLEILVEDTGPGISTADAEALFEPFAQPNAQLAQTHGGSGLGLSLARHLAERMGGELTVQVGRDIGAGFRLSLPAEIEDLAAHQDSTGQPILLICRNDLRAQAFCSTAVAMGLRPLVAVTVEEALTQLDGAVPSLALVSSVGEADPQAVCTKLKAALGPTQPVVLSLTYDAVGTPSATDMVKNFDGATLEPWRRTRLRLLVEQAAEAAIEDLTPLLLGRALVLDDDPTSRRILSVMLESRGYVTVPCATSYEAREQLGGARFDLVLCDLNLSEGSVVDTMADMLGQARPEKTTFIVVTASAKAEDRERCLEAGFDGYLPKPFSPEELEALLPRNQTKNERRHPSIPRPLRTQAPATPSPPPAVELLDMDIVEELRSFLPDGIDELLQELWDTTSRLLDEILATPEDADTAERAFHTVASGTLQTGLSAIGERARALEMQAREIDAAARIAGVHELRELLQRSYIALGAPPPNDTATSPAAVLLIRLVGHLDARKVEQELVQTPLDASQDLRLLIDCGAMSGYDAAAGRAFERWAKATTNGDRIAVVTRNQLWAATMRSISEKLEASVETFWTAGEAETWLES